MLLWPQDTSETPTVPFTCDETATKSVGFWSRANIRRIPRDSWFHTKENVVLIVLCSPSHCLGSFFLSVDKYGSSLIKATCSSISQVESRICWQNRRTSVARSPVSLARKRNHNLEMDPSQLKSWWDSFTCPKPHLTRDSTGFWEPSRSLWCHLLSLLSLSKTTQSCHCQRRSLGKQLWLKRTVHWSGCTSTFPGCKNA